MGRRLRPTLAVVAGHERCRTNHSRLESLGVGRIAARTPARGAELTARGGCRTQTMRWKPNDTSPDESGCECGSSERVGERTSVIVGATPQGRARVTQTRLRSTHTDVATATARPGRSRGSIPQRGSTRRSVYRLPLRRPRTLRRRGPGTAAPGSTAHVHERPPTRPLVAQAVPAAAAPESGESARATSAGPATRQARRRSAAAPALPRAGARMESERSRDARRANPASIASAWVDRAWIAYRSSDSALERSPRQLARTCLTSTG